MKFLPYFVVGIVLLGIQTSVHAKDHGRWLCPSCYIGDIQGNQDVGSTLTDVLAFIKSDVNKSVTQWKANDTVTVCNGSFCLTSFYHASGKWFAVGPPIGDTRSPYKNGSSSGVSFSGASISRDRGPVYQVEITGYWVTVTVEMPSEGYSSSEDRFIVTGVSVTMLSSGLVSDYDPQQ
jgi:hypothetical protein